MSWISLRLCWKNGARVSYSPLDQRLAEEYPARIDRLQRAVVDAPIGVEQDAVQRRPLERGDVPRAFSPNAARNAVGAGSGAAYALQPLRLDARDAARVQARGLGDFRRHDPAPGFLAHARAGWIRNLMPRAPTVMFAVLRLAATLPSSPARRAPVDLRVSRLLADGFHPVRRRTCAAGCGCQPFAHAVYDRKIVAAQIHQLAVGFLVRQCLLVELPQLEPGEEYRIFRRRTSAAPRPPRRRAPAARSRGSCSDNTAAMINTSGQGCPPPSPPGFMRAIQGRAAGARVAARSR